MAVPQPSLGPGGVGVPGTPWQGHCAVPLAFGTTWHLDTSQCTVWDQRFLSALCRPPAPAVLSAALCGPGCATGMGCSVRHCVPGCHLANPGLGTATSPSSAWGQTRCRATCCPFPSRCRSPSFCTPVARCAGISARHTDSGPPQELSRAQSRTPIPGAFPSPAAGQGSAGSRRELRLWAGRGLLRRELSAGSHQQGGESLLLRATHAGGPAGTQPAVPASTWAQRGTAEMPLCW